MIHTSALTRVSIASWHDVDHQEGRGAHQHFSTGGRLTFGARTFEGHAAISAMYAERAAAGTRVARHILSNFHRVDSSDSEPVMDYTLCLFASDGELPLPMTVPAAVADVTDRFELVDNRILIRDRALRFIFVDPGQTIAVPIQ